MTAFVAAYFPHLSLARGGLAILLAACFRRTPAAVFPALAGIFAALPGLWAVSAPEGASGIGCFYAGLLATITLAKPCGQLVGAQIQLTQADPTGDLVQTTGVPTWAEWLDGSGQMLASCTVSAEGGDGDLKISSRADGQIFAGGFITLEEGLIG